MRINEINQQSMLKVDYSKAFYSSVVLYRGMHEDSKFLIKHIRTNRTPLHSSKIQELIFDTFMETCGFPHRKHSTVSFSIDMKLAKDFGNVYQVWASNDAQYLYSTEISDFIAIAQRIRFWFDGVKSTKIHPNRINSLKQYIAKHGLAFNEQLRFTITNNPNELHNAAGEILVYGSSYFAEFKAEGY